MNTPFLRGAAIAALALTVSGLLTSDPASAQLVASEQAKLTQTVSGTVITIDYARPARRDRAPLFGGVMPYGEIITPGANMATTMELSRDVTIGDTDVPAGKYSVWVAFDSEDSWDILLDETWERFHGPHLVREEAEFVIPVTPYRSAVDLPSLTFQFPKIFEDGSGATLRLQWGRTAVDVDVHVEPPEMENISAEAAGAYVGTYDVEVTMIPPLTIYEGTVEMELTYENGFLHSWMEIGPYSDPHDIALFPRAEHVLYPVELIKGIPANDLGQLVYFEFTTDDSGAVNGFQARLQDDTVWLTGARVMR